MYVKLVNEMSEIESHIFECDQVKFKKTSVNIEDKNNEEDENRKYGVLNALFSPPKGKLKYEAILLTLNNNGDIKRLIAPEATLFVLNNSGKTIDVQRCNNDINKGS